MVLRVFMRKALYGMDSTDIHTCSSLTCVARFHKETLPHSLYVFRFLAPPLLLLLHHFYVYAAYQVDNTASPVSVRTGCEVSLMCGGFGTSIQWTIFGGVTPLEENENLSTSSYVSFVLIMDIYSGKISYTSQ